ncbi:MAG: methyltransferase domain-containing protein [Phycisphaerales bacterium]
MPTIEDYLLGTDDIEAVRLGVQHRLWAKQAADVWERAVIRPGSRVLDVGAGPGYASMDLAQLVGPGGRVLGVEGSPRYVDLFRENADRFGFSHAQAVKGDVHEVSTLVGAERGTFDVAYARWVLCFCDDPARVVRGVHDCLAPGGRFAIQDYFGYSGMRLAPHSPAFQRGIAAASHFWDETGDLDVMGDMPRFLREAGFELTHFEVIQRIARPSNQMWAWPSIFWPSFIPRVVEAGHMTQAEADAFLKAWEAAGKNPDAFLLLPPVFEAVAVKK